MLYKRKPRKKVFFLKKIKNASLIGFFSNDGTFCITMLTQSNSLFSKWFRCRVSPPLPPNKKKKSWEKRIFSSRPNIMYIYFFAKPTLFFFFSCAPSCWFSLYLIITQLFKIKKIFKNKRRKIFPQKVRWRGVTLVGGRTVQGFRKGGLYTKCDE